MEIPRKAGIYKLTNKIHRKCYIGKASNLYIRINVHKRAKDKQSIHYAIRKYSWENFEVEILAEFETIDNLELLTLETALIEYFDSTNREIGYNIIKSGIDRTGMFHSEETKKKISQNHHNIFGENNPNFGKHLSLETRKKLSEAHKGKILSEYTKNKIIKSTTGNKNHFYGKSHSDKSKLLIRLSRNKPIQQIDKNTHKVIKIWESTTMAAKSFHLRSSAKSSICSALNGKSKTSNGFLWKYV